MKREWDRESEYIITRCMTVVQRNEGTEIQSRERGEEETKSQKAAVNVNEGHFGECPVQWRLTMKPLAS
jgi:hypothetical protein